MDNNRIELNLPYHFKGKQNFKLFMVAVEGFVDVYSEDNELMYSGYTKEAIAFVNDLNN